MDSMIKVRSRLKSKIIPPDTPPNTFAILKSDTEVKYLNEEEFREFAFSIRKKFSCKSSNYIDHDKNACPFYHARTDTYRFLDTKKRELKMEIVYCHWAHNVTHPSYQMLNKCKSALENKRSATTCELSTDRVADNVSPVSSDCHVLSDQVSDFLSETVLLENAVQNASNFNLQRLTQASAQEMMETLLRSLSEILLESLNTTLCASKSIEANSINVIVATVIQKAHDQMKSLFEDTFDSIQNVRLQAQHEAKHILNEARNEQLLLKEECVNIIKKAEQMSRDAHHTARQDSESVVKSAYEQAAEIKHNAQIEADTLLKSAEQLAAQIIDKARKEADRIGKCEEMCEADKQVEISSSFKKLRPFKIN